MTRPDLHSTEDRCFYCVSDAELGRVLTGPDSRTVHMDTIEDQCPFWAPAAGESA